MQNKGQRQKKCLTTCLTQTKRPSQPTAFAIASIQFQASSIEIYSSQSLDVTRQTRGSGGGRASGRSRYM